VLKIVSGGQTGVDRAALDVAMELGFPVRGWCPLGRLAEDGKIPDSYPLQEHQGGYAARTRANVASADATLILSWGAVTGGTALTLRTCEELGKLHAHLDLRRPQSPELTAEWIRHCAVKVLNVAGPMASKAPDAYATAYRFLHAVLNALQAPPDRMGLNPPQAAGL
jgi:hypothetical protein